MLKSGLALAIVLSLLSCVTAADPSLTGRWKTLESPEAVVILKERPDGLEVNGHLYHLGQDEEGHHYGSNGRYVTHLVRVPGGFHIHSQTIVMARGSLGQLTSSVQIEDTEYVLEGENMRERIDWHDSLRPPDSRRERLFARLNP